MSERSESLLARAAAAGNVPEVTRLLADCSTADLDVRDRDGRTPLALAARSGHAGVVRLLLSRGANPNLCDVDYAAPLWHAAQDGHTDVVRLLLASGRLSNVNTLPYRLHNLREDTPLAMALKQGHRDIVELLAAVPGVDISQKIYWEGDYTSVLRLAVLRGYEDAALALLDTCPAEPDDAAELLLQAASGGYEQVVRRLLGRYGMDVNTAGRYGDRPLIVAARADRASMVRLLLAEEGIQPNLSGPYGSTALMEAAKAGALATVQRLLGDARVDVNQRDQSGCPALSWAARNGHETVVAALLATGTADPSARDSTGATPLLHATDPTYAVGPDDIQRHMRIVDQLMATGRVDVNARNRIGMTALALAARLGWLELVRALLAYPATDPDRGHAFFLAVSAGRVDVAALLLATGRIDVNAVNEDDAQRQTALSFVARWEHTSLLQLLLSVPGIDVNDTRQSGHVPLLLAAEGGHLETVRQLLAMPGIDANRTDAGGSALCHAVLSPAPSWAAYIIRELLAVPHFQPNLTNSGGQTALSLAAGRANDFCVEALLEAASVDRNAPDHAGRSPLLWALQRDESGGRYNRKEVVQRLLQDPAVDPNARDHAGVTALQLALQLPHPEEFVELLVARKDFRAEKTWRDFDAVLGLSSQLLLDQLLPSPEPRPPTRKVPSPASSHEHETSLDEPLPVAESRLRELQSRSTDQYRLPLGVQQDVGPEAAGLCATCAAIDLTAAFSSRHRRSSRAVAQLGRIDASWATRPCPLCRLLYRVCPRPEARGNHTLRSFSLMEAWLCHQNAECWDRFPDDWIDTMVLGVVPDALVDQANADGLSHEEQAQADAQGVLASGFLSRLGANCPRQENSVVVPRLSAHGTDASMQTAKAWVARCQKHHSTRCNPPGKVAIPFFHLIHCPTRRIVDQTGFPDRWTPPYTALSYVWGQPVASSSEAQLPAEAEAVIEDALRVTLALGYSYLWVDRYCIAQAPDTAAAMAVKQTQLQYMNIVYHQAQVTLVAAAGADADTGLPGAPGRPRRPADSAVVQGHALVCVPPDPYFTIGKASAWATRGWTYQEGLLSRRRLFFSPHELSFECRDMLCRESLRLPARIEAASGRPPRLMDALWLYQPQTLPGVQAVERGPGIFALLAAYAVRRLSYASDTLNAMLGIFQLLAEREQAPVYHICGVPILNVPDEPLRGGRPAALHGFASALCWYLRQPACRRDHFPSWSWTGWQGVPGIVEFEHFACAADMRILPRQPDGPPVPWNRYYEQLCAAGRKDSSGQYSSLLAGQDHALEITTSALAIRLYHDDEKDRWIGTTCVGDWMWKGHFWLTEDGLDSQLPLKPWTGIVLGHDDFHEQDLAHLYVLVLQEQRQRPGQSEKWQTASDTNVYWERIGLLELRDTLWDQAVLERQTWRLI